MKRFVIFLIMLAVAIITSGCIHTPAKVAEETPHVLKNISNDISRMETPNISAGIVLQPLKSTADYIKPMINVS